MKVEQNYFEHYLRQFFKYLNNFMLLLWRLGLGRFVNIWPEVIGQIMVITHTGRKTGLKRRTPVNYAIVDGELYCVAGFGYISDWYRNLRQNPEVEVWLPQGWWAGIAEDITGTENWISLMRAVLIGGGFATYLAGINPHKITDEALERVARNYRLLHIHRKEARTGLDGPGDLAWVWPLATTLLLLQAFRRRRK